MHIDVVAISVEALIEHQRSIHERAWIHEATSLTNLHLLNVKYEASIENVESHCALASKKKYLVVSDLMRQTHIRWYPFGLVHLWSCYLLPDIARDIVHFNGIYDSLLIDSSSKSKNVVVFEDTEGCASARYSHISNKLPLIFLSIINFTVAVNLVANKGSDDINEVLNGAD